MTPTPDNPGRHLAGGLRIALRLPTYLYRWHLGWLLGQRFLLPYHANEIRPRRRRVATSGAAVLILLVATSCGTSTSTNSMASTPAQHTSNTDRVNSAYLAQVNGTIVVTSSGDPLYVFAPDKQRAVTCTGACASVWPPLTVAPGTSPTPFCQHDLRHLL
jgi:predicted lipoprotein with Yx(FWY)xxD motif